LNLDLASGLAAALLADAAYQEDETLCKAEFGALGHDVVARMSDDFKQAVVTVDRTKPASGEFYLNVSGSRIAGGDVGKSYGAELGDVIQDVEVEPLSVPGGLATAGPWRRAMAIFDWSRKQAPVGAKWRFRGHSLGAWCDLYAFSAFPLEDVLDVEVLASPKGADEAYWASLPPGALDKVTSWVYRRDLWVGYPWIGPWRHPPGASLAWLDGSAPPRAVTESRWPGGINPHDHDLVVEPGATTGYVAGPGGFRALLAATPPPAG
jgi:hypothetical protein